MSMQDPIADMLTRIRNAVSTRKNKVLIPFSEHKREILKVFLSEGYIKGFEVLNSNDAEVFSSLAVYLKYYNGECVIGLLKRVSKPGLRIYKSFRDLPKVRGGYGTVVVSTSKGLFSDKKAKAHRLGGEVICYIA